jgi:hypothetical protein
VPNGLAFTAEPSGDFRLLRPGEDGPCGTVDCTASTSFAGVCVDEAGARIWIRVCRRCLNDTLGYLENKWKREQEAGRGES